MSSHPTLLQQMIRSFLTEMRKPLWRNFIHAIKTYHMIQPGDRILLPSSLSSSSLLLSVMFIHLREHTEIPFALYWQENPTFFDTKIPRLQEISVFLRDSIQVVSTFFTSAPSEHTLVVETTTLDDVAEKTLYCLFCQGRLRGIPPVSRLEVSAGRIIRPLYHIRRADIVSYFEPFLPFLPDTWKEPEPSILRIRSLLEKMRTGNPDVDMNVFNSLHNVDLDTFPVSPRKESFI